MYVHIRQSGNSKYVYIVEAYRNKKTGKIQHRTVERVGRYDILLQKDPDFLSKLKADAKNRTKIQKKEKAKISVNEMLNDESISSKIDIDTVYNGFPQYNYANIVLRIIFKDIFKLQYRINYLQQSHYSDTVDEDAPQCFDVFFHRILEKALGKYINKSDRYLYFLCDTYSPYEDLKAYRKYEKMLTEINDDVYFYIFNKMAKKANLPWLQFLPLSLDERFLNDLDISISHSENTGSINFDMIKELIQRKQSNYQLRILMVLESIIAKAMLEIIKRRLKERLDLDVEIDDIQDALGHALLTPLIDPENADKIMYIKHACPYMGLINNILRVFELTPLQNFQNRSTLLRNLKMRYSSDVEILGQMVFNTYLYKNAIV